MTSTPEDKQQGPEVDSDLNASKDEISLSKETLEDLDAPEDGVEEARGGAGKCTMLASGC